MSSECRLNLQSILKYLQKIAGKKWEERRKMISPSFNFQLLNAQFQLTFHEKSKLLVDIIKEGIMADDKEGAVVLEMHSTFTKLTLEILCGKVLRSCCVLFMR